MPAAVIFLSEALKEPPEEGRRRVMPSVLIMATNIMLAMMLLRRL